MQTYSRTEAARLPGAVENQVRHWTDIGLVRPSVQDKPGRGRPRLYSFRDLYAIAVSVRLTRFGVPTHRVAGALELLDALRTGDLPVSWGRTPAERLRYFLAVVPGAGRLEIIGAPAARAQELQAELDARRAAGQPWRSFIDPNTRNPSALFVLIWQPERWPLPRLITDKEQLLEALTDEYLHPPASMVLNLGTLLRALERASGDSFVGTLEERLNRAESGAHGGSDE